MKNFGNRTNARTVQIFEVVQIVKTLKSSRKFKSLKKGKEGACHWRETRGARNLRSPAFEAKAEKREIAGEGEIDRRIMPVIY